MRSLLRRLLLATLLVPVARNVFAQPPVQPPVAAPQATPVQTPPPSGTPSPGAAPFTIRTSARLVILDLVVTDAKGNVVTGLTRDDFHVEESSQPQTILNFEQAGSQTVNAALDINSTADLDRLAPRAPVNIILLDEFNTRFEDMTFARYSLKKYLDRQTDKLDTPTMLIAVDLQHFTVLKDYTQNKAAILSALDHHFAAFPWQAHQGGWLAERYGTAFATLRLVAQATVGHSGHKNMIWVGRGFPPLNFSAMPVDTDTRINNAVQDCVNMLRDARVTLYTIDPAGLQVDPGKYGAAAAFNDPFGGDYQFSKLAKATGGRTLYGRNDVDAEIGTAIRDGSSFYTLTYRPTNTSSDLSKFRKIKVTVERPGTTVLTREGYYLQYGPGRVDPTNPSRRLIADLALAKGSTMVYDGVPITAVASPTDPESFLIHVDARALNWTYANGTEPRHAELVLMASIFDKKGKELKSEARVIKISAPLTEPPTGRIERAADLPYKLPHDSKAVRARFVVRITATGRIGTADIPLGQQTAAAPQPSR